MIIETDRLVLRPFRETDAEDVFDYLKDPAVNCFACMKMHSVEETKAEMRERARDTEFTFAIVLKENGKVIGEIDAAPEATAPDRERAPEDTFSPCWMLNRAWHGSLKEFRRVATRYDKLADRFLAFVHLACIRILLA